MARNRAWCFTLNNPTDADRVVWDEDNMKYLVYQLEQGTAETEHYQGYVYWNNMKSLRQLQRWLPRAHFEVAKGSPEQNKHYCTKPVAGCTCQHCTNADSLDGPWEHGVCPEKGKRNDLDTVAQLVKDEGYDAVLREHPGMIIRYHKGLAVLDAEWRRVERKRAMWIKPIIRIYYGPTGTGKTRHCWQKYPDLYQVASHTGGKLWFDDYKGEKTILFDDFGGGMPYRQLLQMLNGYPLQMPVKGAHVWLFAKRFLFTTNIHPDEWYFNDKTNKQDLIAPLQRRIQEYGKVIDYPKTEPTLPSTAPASPDTDALLMSAEELFNLSVGAYETFRDEQLF